jgi:hypothetical protein
MQIKIEIDVKPEELRRFLGLPDVAGLQEDLVHFLRDKLGAASESFDPASFVKDNLQHLRNSSAWKKIVAAAKARAAGLAPEHEPEPAQAPVAKKRARPRAAAKPRPRRKAGQAKKTQDQSAGPAPAMETAEESST